MRAAAGRRCGSAWARTAGARFAVGSAARPRSGKIFAPRWHRASATRSSSVSTMASLPSAWRRRVPRSQLCSPRGFVAGASCWGWRKRGSRVQRQTRGRRARGPHTGTEQSHQQDEFVNDVRLVLYVASNAPGQRARGGALLDVAPETDVCVCVCVCVCVAYAFGLPGVDIARKKSSRSTDRT